MASNHAANDNEPAIVVAYQQEIERLCAELRSAETDRTVLIALVSQLVGLFDSKSFSTAGEQALLAHARFVLGEVLR